MADITDNMISDQDLLDILGVGEDSATEESEQKSEVEEIFAGNITPATQSQEDDEEEADKKMKELQEIATQLSGQVVGKNSGSGDLDTDLSNWFDGVDALPSDPLNNYISNATVKMDYGLSKNVLSSYQLMGKLRKFLEEDAFSMIFSESALMGCDPDEILDRVKVAFTMYKELATVNARVVNDIKNYRIKINETGDIDKLNLLLSSIPSEKLERMLQELSGK